MAITDNLRKGLSVVSRCEHNRQTALDLAGQGFTVFPVQSDKRPFPGFKWKDRASKDPAAVASLWDEFPNGVPAVPTGAANGFDVLDPDKGDGKDGLAALAAMGFEAGSMSPVVVKTPGGGRHIYLAHHEGTGNADSHLPKGLDVRGNGGYVLAPGAWSGAGVYETSGDLAFEFMLGLPEWPSKLLPQPKHAAEPTEPGQHPLDKIRDALFAIPSDVDYRDWVAALMALHHETGGSKQGLAFAQAWSATYDGWTVKEVSDKWRSFGKGDGAKIGAGTLLKIARQHGWTDITADDFDDVEEPETETTHLSFLSPSECAATDPRPYVVKGLVAERDVGCIVGAPGVGKSLLAPGIAYAVAQGETIFGRRVRQGGVFYVAAEDSHGMRGRITALCGERGDAEKFTLVEGVTDLLSEDVRGKGSRDFRALRQAVKRDRPALVVIDTLAMAFPGLEENSAEGMGRVVAVARHLTKWGASVILVHHDTKDGHNGLPRGHSLLNGALDFSIHLKKDGEIVKGRLTKNRNGSCDMTPAFTIRAIEIGIDSDGDTVTAALADPLDRLPPPSLSEKAAIALAVLEGLANDGAVLPEQNWREAVVCEPGLCDSDKPDTRRAAFRRARDELVKAKQVRSEAGGYRINRASSADFDDVEGDDNA